jgi:hypothetical protein
MLFLLQRFDALKGQGQIVEKYAGDAYSYLNIRLHVYN